MSHSYEYSTLLELVSENLKNIIALFPDNDLVLYGDYNARIGETNQHEDILFSNTNLNASRTTNIRNMKCKDLIQSYGEENLIVIDGGSRSDNPAK